MTEETLTPANPHDQAILEKIQELLDVKLESVAEIEWGTRGYVAGTDGAVTGLGLYDCGIGSEKLPALAGLLASLTNLTHLDLSRNKLTDLSGLGNLTNLTQLELRGNQLTDISVLSNLTNLMQLDLGGNQLTDISVLGDLTNLTQLDLGGNQLTDLSVLGNLTNLTQLDLSRNELTDISVLSNLTNLTELHLFNTQLTNISVLSNLTNLTRLDLGFNQLADLSVLGNLTNLTELVLFYTQLTNISDLSNLTNLTRLNLSRNELTDISVLSNLTNLTELVLSNTQLTDISVLSNLTNLTQLDLSRNELTDISVLSNLTNLTELVLSNTQLTDISVLSNLTNLTRLDLRHNELTDISVLGNLTNLTRLDLGGNQLADVSVLRNLTNLTQLDLGSNQLADISDLGNLTNLTRLNLGHNQLTDVSILSNLTNLTELDLSENQLKQIPRQLFDRNWTIDWQKGYFRDGLNLYGNPLETPPVEIVKQGREAVLNYFESSDKGTIRLGEAKVVFVGQGAVGKTSLVRILTGHDFNPKETQTDGISIKEWDVDVDDRNIKLNLWDFGGQEIMHATHQFFLTKRSLYILVLDSRLDESNNRLEYWLKTIQTFGGDSPILIVGNKSDQKPLDIDVVGLKRKYPTIKSVFSTSCDKGWGIDELKEGIREELVSLPHLESPIPMSWKRVKDEIEGLTDFNFTSFATFVDICREHGVTQEQSQLTLINFLHDLGKVLNFHDDKPLQDTNILNPQWVTGGVYHILTNRDVFNNKGLFSSDDLYKMLPKDKYPDSTPDFILAMMKKFELCYQCKTGQYLIPDLLPKAEMDTGDWGHYSRFIYSYDVLPLSILSRFIARVNYHIKDRILWRTGVLLELDGAEGLVKMDVEDRTITIFLRGDDRSRKELLTLIQDQLDRIQSSFSGLKYVRKITIPGRPAVAVDYDHLKNLRKMGIDKFVPEGLQEAFETGELLNLIPGRSMEVRQKTLRVRRVEIENLCCFENLGLDLTGNDWTILLGNNGTGKTTVLRAIAIGLCDVAEATTLIRPQCRGIIRNKNKAGIITIELGYAGQDIPVGRIETILRHNDGDDDIEVSQRCSVEIDRKDIFFCGYGSARSIFSDQKYDKYQTPEANYTLFDYERSLQNPEIALVRLGGKGGPVDEWLKKVDQILMLETGSTSYKLQEGIRVSGPWGKNYPLENLADGYHFTGAFLFDMMGWAAFYYQNNFTADMAGIVLIDEIEQHLHPKWQRQIISRLHEQFPNVQFIVTSHSPICAASMHDKIGQNVLLQAKDGRVEVVTDLPTVSAWRTDQVLASELFGYLIDADPHVEKLLRQASILAGKEGKRTDTEQADFDNIKRRLKEIWVMPGQTSIEREINQERRKELRQKLVEISKEEYGEGDD